MKKESIRSVLAFTGGIFLVLYLHFVPILPAGKSSVHSDERDFFPINKASEDSINYNSTIAKKNQFE